MGKLQARLGRELTLYVRHLAWLHATPKPPPGTKRAKNEAATPRPSRLDQLKRNKVVPPMPPLSAPHVILRLLEIGITTAAGMGSGPVSWTEIEAWQRLTGGKVSPWEARLMRRLSSEYLAEGRRAESENCPPPWRAEVTAREAANEEALLRSVLG